MDFQPLIHLIIIKSGMTFVKHYITNFFFIKKNEYKKKNNP